MNLDNLKLEAGIMATCETSLTVPREVILSSIFYHLSPFPFISSFLLSFPLLSFSWLGWKCEVTHKRKQEEIGLVLQMLFLGRTGKRVYEELVSQEWIFEGKV